MVKAYFLHQLFFFSLVLLEVRTRDYNARFLSFDLSDASDGILYSINEFRLFESILPIRIVDESLIRFPEPENSLHHGLLVFDRSDQKIALKTKGASGSRDVVDIEIGDGSGDLFSILRADGSMDETDVEICRKWHAV